MAHSISYHILHHSITQSSPENKVFVYNIRKLYSHILYLHSRPIFSPLETSPSCQLPSQLYRKTARQTEMKTIQTRQSTKTLAPPQNCNVTRLSTPRRTSSVDLLYQVSPKNRKIVVYTLATIQNHSPKPFL